MNTPNEKDLLKKRVMRHIYLIYLLRQCASPIAFRVYALGLFVVGLFSLVSVENVIANVPDAGLSALYEFVSYAVVNTEYSVQVLLVALVGVMLWLGRDLLYTISHLHNAQQAR